MELHQEGRRFLRPQRTVAIKSIPWTDETEQVHLCRVVQGQWETGVMQRMAGAEHACQLEDAWDDPANRRTCLKLEFIPGADLTSIISDETQRNTWDARSLVAVAFQVSIHCGVVGQAGVDLIGYVLHCSYS